MTSNISLSTSLGGTGKWWRDSAIGVFESRTVAEQAVKELERSGFEMQRLSIIDKDYDSEEHPLVVALSRMGVSREKIIKYEARLDANNYLVVAHGSLQEVENACTILQRNAATTSEIVRSPATNIANHVNIS